MQLGMENVKMKNSGALLQKLRKKLTLLYASITARIDGSAPVHSDPLRNTVHRPRAMELLRTLRTRLSYLETTKREKFLALHFQNTSSLTKCAHSIFEMLLKQP